MLVLAGIAAFLSVMSAAQGTTGSHMEFGDVIDSIRSLSLPYMQHKEAAMGVTDRATDYLEEKLKSISECAETGHSRMKDASKSAAAKAMKSRTGWNHLLGGLTQIATGLDAKDNACTSGIYKLMNTPEMEAMPVTQTPRLWIAPLEEEHNELMTLPGAQIAALLKPTETSSPKDVLATYGEEATAKLGDVLRAVHVMATTVETAHIQKLKQRFNRILRAAELVVEGYKHTQGIEAATGYLSKVVTSADPTKMAALDGMVEYLCHSLDMVTCNSEYDYDE